MVGTLQVAPWCPSPEADLIFDLNYESSGLARRRNLIVLWIKILFLNNVLFFFVTAKNLPAPKKKKVKCVLYDTVYK